MFDALIPEYLLRNQKFLMHLYTFHNKKDASKYKRHFINAAPSKLFFNLKEIGKKVTLIKRRKSYFLILAIRCF